MALPLNLRLHNNRSREQYHKTTDHYVKGMERKKFHCHKGYPFQTHSGAQHYEQLVVPEKILHLDITPFLRYRGAENRVKWIDEDDRHY